MPGRKSNVSAVNGAEEATETTPVRTTKEKDGMSVEDLSLPKSMIQRLAKGVLPANTQIQKDALLALHKSATVFVSYIASNANELAQSGSRKTIAPQDVIAALQDAELENFLPRVEAEMKKYNEIQCDKRNTYRRKVKEEKAAAAAKEGDAGSPTNGEAAAATNGAANGHAEGEDDAERPMKKFKGENGTAAAPEAEAMDLGGGDGQEADELQYEDDDDDDALSHYSASSLAKTDNSTDDEEDEVQDATMGDLDDDGGVRRGMRDEALDEPDSDYGSDG